MGKIPDFISDHIGKIVGTTITSFAVRIFIGLAALYAGSATSAGDAIGIALDKDRSVATCAELINDTPQEQIVEAIEAQDPDADDAPTP